MPSTPPPDDADVFTADTLEEAMAAAVASHGPDLVVHSARRVRAGVRGLMGRETYEVVATPAAPASAPAADPAADPAAGPAAAPSADPVEAALAALLDDAEAREQAQPTPRTPRPKPAAARPKPVRSQPAAPRRQPEERAAQAPAPAAPEPQPPRVQHPLFPVVSRAPRPRPDAGDAAEEVVAEVVDDVVGGDVGKAVADVVAEPAAPRGGQAEEPTAVPPTFPRARRARPEVLEGVVEDGADEPPARPAERRASRKSAKPPVRRATPHPDPAVAEHTTSGARSWSRARLRRLGVPAKVLSLLPAEDPRDDLAWLVALTGAIAATVPAPAEPSASTPAVVHGYELAGALAILDACSRGAHPGTLTTGGRTVPATPTELALLVRSHVLADDV